MLINIRSIIDDIVQLSNGGARFTSKIHIKLVIIGTIDDLTIAAVDIRDGIALITLKDSFNTKVEAARNLSVGGNFSDVNLDVSAIDKSNFLANSILGTIDLILVGSQIIRI
ncbi:MAG: hypothetical protein EOO61_11855 [Hymenobacter sp.]|nr:MAG: hypothetical protein EOO61_11855 [Hymenobacter sp.]